MIITISVYAILSRFGDKSASCYTKAHKVQRITADACSHCMALDNCLSECQLLTRLVAVQLLFECNPAQQNSGNCLTAAHDKTT